MTEIEVNSDSSSNQKLQTTVRLEAEMFAEIDKIMLSLGVSRAEVIRRVLKIGLEEFRDEYI